MINNNKLPECNTYEELLILRTCLEWKDIYAYLSKYYKNLSKFFMVMLILKWVFIASQSVICSYYPNPFNVNDDNILVFSTLIATFISGMLAYLNPINKWLNLKNSERQIDSEIWKFRTRVGD